LARILYKINYIFRAALYAAIQRDWQKIFFSIKTLKSKGKRDIMQEYKLKLFRTIQKTTQNYDF
jgi:hypothetical protein